MVVSYRRFGTTYRSHLNGSSRPRRKPKNLLEVAPIWAYIRCFHLVFVTDSFPSTRNLSKVLLTILFPKYVNIFYWSFSGNRYQRNTLMKEEMLAICIYQHFPNSSNNTRLSLLNIAVLQEKYRRQQFCQQTRVMLRRAWDQSRMRSLHRTENIKPISKATRKGRCIPWMVFKQCLLFTHDVAVVLVHTVRSKLSRHQ